MAGLEPGVHRFRLKQVDFDGSFSYSPEVEVVLEVPGTHRLSEAYPNPFNPQATFTLAVAEEQTVRIDLFDAAGRFVATLHDGHLAADVAHRFVLDGAGRPRGCIFTARRARRLPRAVP